MSLRLRTQNHPSLQGCFGGMPLIPVPMYGVKMSSQPSKWLLHTKSGRHERNWREFSVVGFVFPYVQKYVSGSLGGGGGDRPYIAPMDLLLNENLLQTQHTCNTYESQAVNCCAQ